MWILRLLGVVGHLLFGLFIAGTVFPFMSGARRARIKQHWSGGLLRVCGVRLRYQMSGTDAPVPRALIVANHVSWLDIFVLNAVLPSHFVAKSDIRSWPIIGWLCDKAGTIFIARGRVRDVRRIFEHLVELLAKGEYVTFFPEGTTAAQGRLLPFFGNLFEAAIDAKVPVQPFALRYLTPTGELHAAADFIGETTFAESMLTILRGAPLIAELTLLPAIPSAGMQRRELAAVARQHIATALGVELATDEVATQVETEASATV